ncbi:MAG: restriction endonuclease subunit S [Pseudomonadota bacterium]
MSTEVNKMRDFCETTSSKRIYASEYVNAGVPFYRSKEVIERQSGKREVSTEIYISESRFEEIERKFGAPQKGDVLLTSVGTLGVPYVVGEGERFYFKDGNLTWFRNFRGLDSRYLYYWLLSPLGKSELNKATIGSSQSAYTINLLSNLDINPPVIDEQHKVVELLSAYDDLIENNRHRITLLEESARLLYCEWFVKLRFPGHELVKVVNGVPEGWAKKTLDELAHIIMGQSPESKYYNTEKNGLPFHQGVSDFGDRFVSHSTFTSQTTRIAEAGDILCSVRAPVGRLNVTSDKIAIGRGLSAMRSKMNLQSLLFYQLKGLFLTEDMIGSGAIFASVCKKELFGQKLLQPDKETAVQFNQIATVIDSQIETLIMKNCALIEARDSLLPKLMSGQLAA